MRRRLGRPTRGELVVALALACLTGACSARPAAPDWNVDGPIRAIDGNVWVVGDRLVTIAPDARVDGAPALGSMARVRGVLNEHGSPVGESVEIVPPTQVPAPPATPPTVSAPPPAPAVPAPAAPPAAQPKPQPGPERDDGDKPDRRGPPPKPANEQNRGGKPKGH
jgi:hypothetical protein